MQQSTAQVKADSTVWEEVESLDTLPAAITRTVPEAPADSPEDTEEPVGLSEAEEAFGEDELFQDDQDGYDDVADHLKQYMREAAKTPLLTQEREREIARSIEEAKKELEGFGLSPSAAQELLRILSRTAADNNRLHGAGCCEGKTGHTAAELKHRMEGIKSAHERYLAARNELINANLRLVMTIAKKYTNRGLSFPDLVQEGNVGLMKAVEKFDCRMGYRFSTYAVWWIKQTIRRALKEQTRTIYVPTHVQEVAERVARCSQQLSQRLGRDALPHEIAEGMDLAVDKVREVLHIAHEPVSLHAPAGDEGRNLVEFIEDKSTGGPQDPMLSNDFAKEVEGALSRLSEREEKLIRMRFGIGDKTAHTLEELSETFGLSRERVRQIEAKALKKLKSYAQSLNPDVARTMHVYYAR